MSSMFCAVSFIKDITTATKYTAGTAVYRAGDDEFIEYKFKAFYLERIAEKFSTHPTSNNNFSKNTPQRNSRQNVSNNPTAITSSEDTRFNLLRTTLDQFK
ncbi:13201_t:CDS:2, partial [Racocetra fulgida]